MVVDVQRDLVLHLLVSCAVEEEEGRRVVSITSPK